MKTMIRQLRFVPAFAIVMIALVAIAQTPKPGAPPAGTATATSGTTSTTGTNVQQSLQEILEEPATGETYHYDPQGRREAPGRGREVSLRPGGTPRSVPLAHRSGAEAPAGRASARTGRIPHRRNEAAGCDQDQAGARRHDQRAGQQGISRSRRRQGPRWRSDSRYPLLRGVPAGGQ